MDFDPVATLVAYHAALQPYDRDRVAAFFAPEAIYGSPGIGGVLVGKPAILAAFDAYFAQFPDQMATDTSITPTGAHAARANWRLSATDARTGKTSTRSGTEDILFNAEGLILAVTVRDQT